jgi:hypothetical protein
MNQHARAKRSTALYSFFTLDTKLPLPVWERIEGRGNNFQFSAAIIGKKTPLCQTLMHKPILFRPFLHPVYDKGTTSLILSLQ